MSAARSGRRADTPERRADTPEPRAGASDRRAETPAPATTTPRASEDTNAPARDDCRRALDEIAAAGAPPAAALATLAATPADVLDQMLRELADERGAAALDVLTKLTGDRAERPVRRAAKRALYRLSQRGVSGPAPPPSRPVVARHADRAVRAWLSAIDGSGSRAAWMVFESGFGGLELTSLILSDTVGIVEVAGGEISKKRLATELEALRRDQKLPWVETDPLRAAGLVAEALALHRHAGTAPPAAFERWRARFEVIAPVVPPVPTDSPDASLIARGAELLELPEIAGWFLDPDAVSSDALELLQARESRLVVSDQIKAEREQALVSRVVERDLTPAARSLWTRRLLEMSLVHRALGRETHAALEEAVASALGDLSRDASAQPFARALARRALDVAGEVALGRMSASDVSRKPGPVTRG